MGYHIWIYIYDSFWSLYSWYGYIYIQKRKNMYDYIYISSFEMFWKDFSSWVAARYVLKCQHDPSVEAWYPGVWRLWCRQLAWDTPPGSLMLGKLGFPQVQTHPLYQNLASWNSVGNITVGLSFTWAEMLWWCLNAWWCEVMAQTGLGSSRVTSKGGCSI